MRTNLTSCALYLNTWRYLQVIDPRVTRHKHNHDLTTQKGVIKRHFHDMVEHYHDHWARWMIAHHSHLMCGPTKVTNLKEPQCVLYLVLGPIKEHSIT